MYVEVEELEGKATVMCYRYIMFDRYVYGIKCFVPEEERYIPDTYHSN